MILQALPDARSFRIVPRQSEWDTAFFEKLQDPLFQKARHGRRFDRESIAGFERDAEVNVVSLVNSRSSLYSREVLQMTRPLKGSR